MIIDQTEDVSDIKDSGIAKPKIPPTIASNLIHKKLSLLKKGQNPHTNSGTSIEDAPSSRNLIQPNNPINGRLPSTVIQSNTSQITSGIPISS